MSKKSTWKEKQTTQQQCQQIQLPNFLKTTDNTYKDRVEEHFFFSLNKK